MSGNAGLNIDIYFTTVYHMNMKRRVYTQEIKETENSSLMKMIQWTKRVKSESTMVGHSSYPMTAETEDRRR